MKLGLSFTCLFFSLSVLSAKEILLDEVMNKETQKKTGISRLSSSQKMALEQWLNTTFVLKNPSQTQESLSLSININHGQKIQLSDNSVWEIAPADRAKASLWIVPFPIKLGASNDPAFPTLIINVTSGESVKARRSEYNASESEVP